MPICSIYNIKFSTGKIVKLLSRDFFTVRAAVVAKCGFQSRDKEPVKLHCSH